MDDAVQCDAVQNGRTVYWTALYSATWLLFGVTVRISLFPRTVKKDVGHQLCSALLQRGSGRAGDALGGERQRLCSRGAARAAHRARLGFHDADGGICGAVGGEVELSPAGVL